MKQFDDIKSGRREFLRSSGYLLMGFTLMPGLGFSTEPDECYSPEQILIADREAVDSWIRIDEQGILTVLTGKMELGQGIRTALMQMAAKELDIDIKQVRIIIADTGQTQDERYTAGSGSIEGSGNAIRNAAAEARKYLLILAAKELKSNVAELSVNNGIVKSAKNQKTVAYKDLVKGKRLEAEVTGKSELKKPADYKLVGKPIKRTDINDIAAAKTHFIQDLRLPDMVHARVMRPPVYSARLVSFPTDEIQKLPGVLKVVVNGNFAAVIASQEFESIKALEKMKQLAKWDSKPITPLPGQLYADMIKNGSAGEIVEGDKSADKKLSENTITLEAEYKRPYQMHGSIGPSCAIGLWKDDQLTIWSHTQGVFPLRSTVSDLVNLPLEKIRVIGVPGAGCYGHNGADDVGGDAALLALQMPGKPVRVQWMREDEHKWEPYGSAMVLNIKAAISEGKVTSWQTDIWSDTHSSRPGGKAGHLIAGRHLEKPFAFEGGGFSGGSHRNSLPLYDFETKNVALHNYKGPLRTSALRSLGAYGNIFALESFMDELAAKAGKDPVRFRLDHLKDARAKEVITTLVTKAGWDSNKKAGLGKGFAFAQYKNNASYFAVKAEVQLDRATRTYRLVKLTGVIDSGQAINPDGIINQTSGGMIQAASWTMLEQVNYGANGVESNSWETYPILRFEDVPDTEVFVVDRPELKPLGAGEAAQGPVSAAIANAIFDATGSRLREIPLTPDKIDWSKIS
ncbi:xanthine dehydrogenase family protein molybdopterin-binding subunit [Dyadobacter psychrophilus]|uniref:CO or xanthine dehydrogenase, Mo-binding subunit n=1 Tax=Dyadobacter psychrophilus TaxID=651661 RepID=A0A1T5HAX6_9BACT|nr:molybdopterin cofactor-binding domain-containing protein [Dyadobacter psychrophilus]SKC17853.1 CO or xanthine dehydrogenase, Mo-binding subunit [Dyadobacter psychrophilus]